MTAIQLIEETAEYYSNYTNRAISYSGEGCYYFLKEKRCAVGRLLDDSKFDELLKEQANNTGGVYAFDTRLGFKSYCQDKYKHFPIELLSDLQIFHDENEYWNSRGLTKAGIVYKNSLIEKWKTKTL